MVISDTIKSMFVEDCDIPIVLFYEPFFSDRLELYNSKYNTVAKWNSYLDVAQHYNTIEEYQNEYISTIKNAVKSIKSTNGYKKFVKSGPWKVIEEYGRVPKNEIFTESNIGQAYIEICMRRSNFTCLRTFNDSIFGSAESWEDFISTFTNNQNIINSKYVRNTILGECNKSQQTAYTRYLMSGVLYSLIKNGIPLDTVAFSGNSLILNITQFKNDNNMMNWINFFDAVSKVSSECGFPVRLDIYNLLGVKKNGKLIGYIKRYADQSIMEFKNIDHFNLPFVLRTLKNEPIRPSDLIFEHMGELATYTKIPKIEIVEGVTSSVANLLTMLNM